MATPVFLRWAAALRAPDDPRPANGPPAAGAAGSPAARPEDGWSARFAQGPMALAFARGRLPRPAAPRRIVLNGGDPPDLLAAVERGFRHEADEVRLVAPDPDGVPDVGSLDLALGSAPAGSGVVILGAVSPTGTAPPLAEIAALCRARRAALVLDLTLARFTPPPAPARLETTAVVTALDRWDGAAPGTWAAAVTPAPLPWPAPPAAEMLHLDAALRAALSSLPGVSVWPLAGLRHATGVIGFALGGWAADEAAALLAEAFGVGVESGDLSAVPLPFPAPAGPGLLRASLGRATTPDDVDALASAVSQLLDRTPRGPLH